MCGIIGYRNTQTTKDDLSVLSRVLIESRIRGKHASGIAWFDGKSIKSYVKPIPIDELLTKFNLSKTVYDGNISLIAHSRYSTSDIRYNQPIVGNHLAIAMNGVITQSSPDTWEETYGYKCKTKNDSELLLRALENDDNVFEVFDSSSIAMVALDDTGNLMYTRNGIRPLWMGKIGNGTVYASTYDILNRAGVQGITKINPSDYRELQRRDMRHGFQESK